MLGQKQFCSKKWGLTDDAASLGWVVQDNSIVRNIWNIQNLAMITLLCIRDDRRSSMRNTARTVWQCSSKTTVCQPSYLGPQGIHWLRQCCWPWSVSFSIGTAVICTKLMFGKNMGHRQTDRQTEFWSVAVICVIGNNSYNMVADHTRTFSSLMRQPTLCTGQ